MTLVVKSLPDEDVRVEVDTRNFQNLVYRHLTLQWRPTAQAHTKPVKTTINGRKYDGLLTPLRASNRMQVSLGFENDEELVLVAVEALHEEAAGLTVSYYFCMMRMALMGWHLPHDANIIRRQGKLPDEFTRLRQSLQYQFLGY